MNKPIRYVAEPTHVREVSLLGTADLSFWTQRLVGEGLRPAQRDGRAQVQIIAAEMAFIGLRFSEVSFNVLVLVPEHEAQMAAFLVQAFNSRRLFVFFERRLFATPYSHADCQVSISAGASIRIRSKGETVFLAEMPSTSARQPSRSGEEGWEGPIFLPESRRGSGEEARLFFGRLKGHTLAYPFLSPPDVVSITPSRPGALRDLLDSGFSVVEWLVRADATHGKSKTYRRHGEGNPAGGTPTQGGNLPQRR